MNQENELLLLKDDLRYVTNHLKQIAEEILDNEISKYPIFAASKAPINIGKKVIDANDFDISWDFYASHLEDFVNKGIVKMENAQEFIKLYKEKSGQLCLFVVLKSESKFVFSPM